MGRWDNVTRPYTDQDVEILRGSLQETHTLAKHTAEKLWELINSDDEGVVPAGKIVNAMAEQNELDRQAKEASARRINEIYGGATGPEPRY